MNVPSPQGQGRGAFLLGLIDLALSHRCWYKGEILDLEEEGLWRELLDSGKIWISVCRR